MFNRVIWATDGTAEADQALPVAKRLVTESGGQLLIIHCQERTLPGKGGGRVTRAANEDELVTKIEDQVKELSDSGIDAHLKMVRAEVGEAAGVIADAARADRADVIVLASRGHTALGGLFVGDMTQKLLHHSPCPVLAVPVGRDG